MRINQFLARAGLGSRRECETIVASGRVAINGETVTKLATRVEAGDNVQVDGNPVQEQRLLTAILNKPAGYVTSAIEEGSGPTIFELLPKDWPRVFYVGRLDKASEGLLLLTNDGPLAQDLSHPTKHVRKIYEVALNRDFDFRDSARLREGFPIEGGFGKCESIERIDKKHLRVTLIQGIKRQIRIMFEMLGYDVVRLVRTQMGDLKLAELPPARWRILNDEEIELTLRKPLREASSSPIRSTGKPAPRPGAAAKPKPKAKSQDSEPGELEADGHDEELEETDGAIGSHVEAERDEAEHHETGDDSHDEVVDGDVESEGDDHGDDQSADSSAEKSAPRERKPFAPAARPESKTASENEEFDKLLASENRGPARREYQPNARGDRPRYQDKRSQAPRPGGPRPFRPAGAGGDFRGGQGGERRPFRPAGAGGDFRGGQGGERRPFRPAGAGGDFRGGQGGERRPFRPAGAGGDFRGGQGGERRPFRPAGAGGDFRGGQGGERRPFRPAGAGGDFRGGQGGERRPFRPAGAGGDFRGGQGGERRPFRPAGAEGEGGERRPFRPAGAGGGFGGGERRPFRPAGVGGGFGGGERRPFRPAGAGGGAGAGGEQRRPFRPAGSGGFGPPRRPFSGGGAGGGYGGKPKFAPRPPRPPR